MSENSPDDTKGRCKVKPLFRLGAACLLGLCCTVTLAQTDPEQKKRLVEQKLKLVEMLIHSPAAGNASVGREAEAPVLIERSKALVDKAKEALKASQFDAAAQSLDEALRNVAKANSKLTGEDGLSESAQKRQLADLEEQVGTYRTAIADLSRDSRVGAATQPLLARIDALADEGRKLAGAGHPGDASKKMAQAYKLAVEELSRLRAGQEVVMSLKFDTPADEFSYEQKRFQSNEILVGMMLAEGRGEGDKRPLVDGFVAEATKLRDQALLQAQSRQHKDAVATMEKAQIQLNRALQAMGVPVF